jgi:hypothetical protein
MSFCEIFPIFREGNHYRETAASALTTYCLHVCCIVLDPLRLYAFDNDP